MPAPLIGISSMATRQMLAVLLQRWHAAGGAQTRIESLGGVDAAMRVQRGAEPFDLVFLAADAIDKLGAAGRLVAGSKVDLARSSVAVAIRAGATRPDLSSSDRLRAAVLAAPAIAYSTGPSGVAMQRLFQQWGIARQVADKTVQARPGVPVASLLASGEVTLGFQQLSELMHVVGIEVLGPLPADVAVTTVFSGAIVQGSAQVESARRLLAFMASSSAAQAKLDEGLELIA